MTLSTLDLGLNFGNRWAFLAAAKAFVLVVVAAGAVQALGVNPCQTAMCELPIEIRVILERFVTESAIAFILVGWVTSAKLRQWSTGLGLQTVTTHLYLREFVLLAFRRIDEVFGVGDVVCGRCWSPRNLIDGEVVLGHGDVRCHPDRPSLIILIVKLSVSSEVVSHVDASRLKLVIKGLGCH